MNDDNFHKASELFPFHHPEIDSDCLDKTGPCSVTHYSVTQNKYDKLNELDLGKTPIASQSMRVKFKSVTSLHVAAREADASFEQLDQQGTECANLD